MNEFRRHTRRAIPQTVDVTDTMTGDIVGRMGNLSAGGMMLIGSAPLVEEALYQFRFSLPDGRGGLRRIQVGAQQQWSDASAGSGQVWAGFRFIDVPPKDIGFLRSWAESASPADMR
jgi:hypothetical protein